jgi:hypothetical protein
MSKYKSVILYIIFIILGFIFAITRIQPQIVQFFNIEKDIKEKSIQVVDAKKQLDELEKTENEKNSTNTDLKKIYKPDILGFNSDSSFTLMFGDIITMAKYNGIRVYSIDYLYDPQDDDFIKGASGKFNVCQLNMSLVSDYLNLESFLKELYKYPYLININKLELIPYPKNKRILLVALQLKLYASK